MFHAITVGLKEGLDPEPLLALAEQVAAPGARIHLASYIMLGTNKDEPERQTSETENVERHAERLRELGFETSTEVSIIGVAAAHELVSSAARFDADLLVIGLAKRTRVGKALMGSDAQRVLLASTCPVLSVHVHH